MARRVSPAAGTPAPVRTKPLDVVIRELRGRLEALARVAFATRDPLARRAMMRETADLHYQLTLLTEIVPMPRKPVNLDRVEDAILNYSHDRGVDLALSEVDDGNGLDGLRIELRDLPVVVTVWTDRLVEVEEGETCRHHRYRNPAQLWRLATGEDEENAG